MREPTFTVFTPTYNRAHLLRRAYESLRCQTFRDFEWIVIDDGSEDETASVVAQWQREADFPIHYFWQVNSGKHVAFNRGVEHAAGALFVNLDSDDWLTPNALERILYHWESIPRDRREEYAGVAGLYAYRDGTVVGTRFPRDVLDADAITVRTRYRVRGDKLGMIRTEVLRQFPFPENLGRFVPEALIWRRIALHYKERYVNEIFGYKEYQDGGLTDPHNPTRALLMRIQSAHAMRLMLREYAEMPPQKVPLRKRAKAYSEFARYSLHAAIGICQQLAEVRTKPLFLAAFPAGLLAYLNDKRRIKRYLFQQSRDAR